MMRLALLGDICLTGKFDLTKNKRAYEQFDEVQDVLSDCDFVVGNLESPFTTQSSSRVCKAIHIKSDPANVDLLSRLGVAAVSLANNHVFDYDFEGYHSTLRTLDAAGIGHFGTAGNVYSFKGQEDSLAFGGFCCLSANPSKATARGVNSLNLPSVNRFMDQAREESALPIVSVHWGDENVHYPREDHVRLARLLARKHRYILHGHHPHVIQGIEQTSDALLAYSLGNFCTDIHVSETVRDLRVLQSLENAQSFILKVDIGAGLIVRHEVVPIVDTGARIKVGDFAIRQQLETYSSSFSTHYRRPKPEPPVAHVVPGQNRRFGVQWFAKRLNYHFIGACLKGLINRHRYKKIFATLDS